MRNFLGALAGLIMVMAGAAFAATLSDDEVKRFVESLESAEALGEEMQSSGKADALAFETTPKAGEEFKPYSKAVAALKTTYPADYSKLAAAVRPHGFSPEEWGATGDRVVIAYLAEKMAKENPEAAAQMAAMDPAMLAMVPEAQRAQMQAMFSLMETVNNAPAEDRDAVRPYIEAIDESMDD